MTKATIGFAMCGSFCTFSKAFTQMQRLVDSGYDVIPIMSVYGQHACKAVARNYRHGGNNGGKVASENFKTCAVVRCNK